MILLFYIFSFLSPLASLHSMDEHPIHVSICEMKYNETAYAFQVSIKIFIDDLELAVQKEGLPPLHLGSKKENENTEINLAAYLIKYFTIKVDGQNLNAQLFGKELSEDFLAVWCYIEFPATISRGQKYTISNRVLLDLYSDQRNIMDIRMNSTQKEYTIFDPSNSSWSYTY